MITKLDLMDEGTDAKDILENKLLPLRRGEHTHLNTNSTCSLYFRARAMTHCFPLVAVRQSYSKMFNAPTTETKTQKSEKGRRDGGGCDKIVLSKKSKDKQKGGRGEELERRSREGAKRKTLGKELACIL